MSSHSTHPPLPLRESDFQLDANIGAGMRNMLLGLALAGVAVALIGGFVLSSRGDQGGFFLGHAYLVAFMFYLSISLGGLFMTMIMHLVNWRTGVVTRRIYEIAMKNLFWLPIAFVPIALMVKSIYPWADVEHLQHEIAHGDHHHAHHAKLILSKSAYLNVGFFYLRAVFYFAVWMAMAAFFYFGSKRVDATGDFRYRQRMISLSAPGVIVFALTTTFAAFDWLMSLDPAWYSTIYGVWYFAGCVLAILSTSVLLIRFASKNENIRNSITVEHLHDIGKLLFAFIVFWAYISFSQFLLIWMADIPEETMWYMYRWEDMGWRIVSIFQIVGHFFLPFLFLLSRHIKRNRLLLTVGACYVLFVHFIDIYWNVMPNLPGHTFTIAGFMMCLGMWLGLGAIYFFLTIRSMTRDVLVPVRDPYIAESLAFENH